MELRPELAATLTSLGLGGAEVELLRQRMMFAVTNLEASLNALNMQIQTLTAQRDQIEEELINANITVAKLVTS